MFICYGSSTSRLSHRSTVSKWLNTSTVKLSIMAVLNFCNLIYYIISVPLILLAKLSNTLK